MRMRKGIVKSSFCVLLAIVVILNWFGCQNNDRNIHLTYKFKKDKNHLSTSRLFIKANVNKIVLPKKDSIQDKANLLPFKKDFISSDIKDMFTSGSIKKCEFEMLTDLDETVGNNCTDSAEIFVAKQIKKLSFKANDSDLELPQTLISILKLLVGEEKQLRKLNSNGEWHNLPNVIGMNMATVKDDPYVSRLLSYLKKDFSLPKEKIDTGYIWNNNLHILIPVDSLSKGQAKGFIQFEIVNHRQLKHIEKGIANIKLDLSINVSWDVLVPSQGFTKCNFLVKGKGYQFFDVKKGWDYGMFLKGDFQFCIDAETIDKIDKNKKNIIAIDLSGVIELANKLREK